LGIRCAKRFTCSTVLTVKPRIRYEATSPTTGVQSVWMLVCIAYMSAYISQRPPKFLYMIPAAVAQSFDDFSARYTSGFVDDSCFQIMG